MSENPRSGLVRVTLDLDPKPGFRLRAVRAWHHFQREAEHVDLWVSSSDTGLHFVAWYEGPLSPVEKIKIRESLGDDPNRIKMDVQRLKRGHPIGTLWDVKTGRDGEVRRSDRDFSDVYAALDYIEEKNTTDQEQMKALANSGHKGAPDLARRARRAEA